MKALANVLRMQTSVCGFGVVLAVIGISCFAFQGLGAEEELNCPPGSAEVSGLCWFQTRKAVEWEAASTYCEGKSARLPTPDEVRTLFVAIPLKEDLSARLKLKSIPMFWTSRLLGGQVLVVLSTGKDITMAKDSRLYAQCVKPAE